jgi:hypothetical protein
MAQDEGTQPIEATYRDESEAAEALRELTASGIPAEASRRELEDPVSSHAYETKEGSDVAVGVALPPMTTYQLRSAAGGSVAGALILGVLGAIAAAILLAVDSIGWAAFAAIVAGAAVGGATIGAILGGSLGGVEEMEVEERYHDEVVRVLVRPRNDGEARKAHDVLAGHRPDGIREHRRGA